MIIRSVLLAAIMTSAAGAASAQYFPQPAYVPPLRMPRDVIRLRFANRIEALRQEALAQRHADGGVLTPSHRAALQSKLDQIHASYRRAVNHNDPMSVNADGSPRS